MDVPDQINHARSLMDEKRFDEAISLLEQCEQACPGDEFVAAELAEAYSDRGYFSLRENQPDQAQKDFESALKYSPVPEARLGLAQFAVVAGQVAEAKDLADRILEEHPDFFPAREFLAKICMGKEDLAGAEEQYRQILNDTPVPRVILSLVSLLEGQGRSEEALGVLSEGRLALPDEEELILALSRRVSSEEGWRILNQALAGAPRSFELWFERACIACRQNDPEEAAISMNHCLEIDSERTRSSWKAELGREGSFVAPFADHPYLSTFQSGE